MEKFTVGGLFSGVGGIELGLKQAGFETIWANEFDKYAAKTYRLNHGDHLIEDDIHIKTTKYTVFFVDYGYQKILNMHDLLPLPKKFVERLPLQAIGCSLSNIAPSAEDDLPWSDDAIEFFNQFASISDCFSDGDRRFITAKSMLLLKAIGATKCEYYEEYIH